MKTQLIQPVPGGINPSCPGPHGNRREKAKLSCYAGLASICLAGSVSGAVIAYDGFAYPVGPLAFQGPGTGFSAPWLANPGVSVTSPGLSSPLALPSTGNAVSGFFDYESPLSTTLVNRDFWASFLVAHTGPNDQTYMGLTQSAIPFGTPPLVAFGIRLGQYGIFDSGSGFTASAVPFTPAGSTDFLLAHIRPVGPFYQVDLFVNPSSLAFPSVTVNVPPVFYDAIENQNQAEFTSDEVRLGDTAFDAGFVPAPGAGTLVMLAGLIACRRRR